MNDLMKIKKELADNGYDFNRLTKALAYAYREKMKFDEICDYITSLEFSFAEVRFAPKAILKKRLGVDMTTIVNLGNTYMLMAVKEGWNPLNHFTESAFRIVGTKDKKIDEIGFFVRPPDEGSANKVANDNLPDFINYLKRKGINIEYSLAA